MKSITLLCKFILRLYQWTISPFLTPNCRYQPTCSQYALDALNHSGLKALGPIIKRIASCHPWGGSGFDPYPNHTKTKTK